MGYDPAISLPTLIGSLLSCLATSCVLLSYTIYVQQQRSFRHALVFNLALAEFVNSLNNSISGIYVVAHRHRVSAGTACEFNGFIGQLSVQAADFSILAIALITLLTVIKKTYIPSASWFRKLVICASVWFVPLITSSTAAGFGALQPTGGNWCWISRDRTDLRYALGHGWRFLIILATVCIYAYIYIYIQHHFSSSKALRLSVFGAYVSTAPPSRDLGKLEMDLAKPNPTLTSQKALESKDLQMIAEIDQEVSKRLSEHIETARHSMALTRLHSRPEPDSITPTTPTTATTTTPSNLTNLLAEPNAALRRNSELTIDIPSHSLELHFLDYPFPPSSAILSRQRLREKPSQTLTIDTTITPSSPPPPELFESPTSIRTHMQQQSSHRHAQVEREVRRMLLLNAYPVAYVVLWLPGIANRIVEAAMGSSPRWLLILQSTTQYIGLANALTYGFNEHMRSRVRRDLTEGFGWSWRRGVV
ncbi:Epoxide hydrolase-like protein [Neofusicoccum parvum]|uniref:Epoxide hydrolase-like protein n=1 Tax=Neofusicoccum parvum TaxID=310453 RepID=A0ACB5SGW6_9PEZI|nr:Epoxide hydrolase-like protein [Neofusicoccum parvum]